MRKGDLVSDSETLLRRVYRKDRHYIDRRTGLPTSRAFAPRPKDNGKLSVEIKSMTSFQEAIVNAEKFRLFNVLAKLVYELGLSCIYDPIDNNIAHALITGFDPEDESVPGILARSSTEATNTF